jgi:hypothetical protein
MRITKGPKRKKLYQELDNATKAYEITRAQLAALQAQNSSLVIKVSLLLLLLLLPQESCCCCFSAIVFMQLHSCTTTSQHTRLNALYKINN